MTWVTGLIDPFTVIRSCEHLAGLDLGDAWPLPYIAHVPPARAIDEDWNAPTVLDLLTRERVTVEEGIVVVLGLHRLQAVEEALRGAPENVPVTLVATTADQEELWPLVRLILAELRVHLSHAFAASAWDRLRIVLDPAVALASGVGEADDETELALSLSGGRARARAEGRGAAHAVAVVAAEAARTGESVGR